MTNTYFNEGLLQKYGPGAAGPNKAGEYRLDGPLHVIEAEIDLTTVGSTNGGTYVSDQVSFPANAIVEQIDVMTKTAATGTGAVLNLGLIKRDRATEIDYNGLLAALPQTSLATKGDKVTENTGGTYAGALVGTTIGSVPGYLVCDYDTAAFTAGVVIVRISYRFD